MGLRKRVVYLLTKGFMPFQIKPGEDSPYTCPVCTMKVKPESPLKASYHGTEYHFCGEGCLARFQRHPDRYAERRAV